MRLSTLMTLVWALGTAGTFGWLAVKSTTPAKRPDGAAVAKPGKPAPVAELRWTGGRVDLRAPGQVLVLNFWNPDCGCSKAMEWHVADLVKNLGREVQFVTLVQVVGDRSPVSALEAWEKTGIPTPAIADDGRYAREFGVWAAPAAVVVDQVGRVRYTGSYNLTRTCRAPENQFARKAIEAVLAGSRVGVETTPFYGCQVRGK